MGKSAERRKSQPDAAEVGLKCPQNARKVGLKCPQNARKVGLKNPFRGPDLPAEKVRHGGRRRKNTESAESAEDARRR